MTRRDTYTHGHHPTVLANHSWRTAENSVAYLLTHLEAGMRLLDVGCGPGTISLDLAERVAPGEVIGIDTAADVIAVAEANRVERGTPNITFRVGDVYALDFEDDSFDMVQAHQLLQHLSDPVAALAEMRRVCRPDGIVAVRESDYAGFLWAPLDPRLDRWLALYHEVARSNDAEPDAGRFLLGWAQQAGFAEIVPSASVWCFANETDRAWWGGTWSQRVTVSEFARQAMDRGLATSEELAAMSQAWSEWASAPDGWFVVVHGQVVCRP
jgi:ubiquinone/menaquinone biosynthesis C-methylase UbiE